MLIPYAVDKEGKLHNAKEAEKGKQYYCPSCGEKVILRKGKIRTAHFAHKANANCSEETVIHRTAKLLIQQTVQSWKKGNKKAPVIIAECPICYNPSEVRIVEQMGIENAVLEYRVHEGYIADVALVANNKVKMIVEIKVTHAVEKKKEEKINVPFVELDGYDVINNPFTWKPSKHKLPFFICNNCKGAYKKFLKKAETIAQKTKVKIPTEYYLYGITKCWKCRKEILVFTWAGHTSFSREMPKKRPFPRTIQYRYSKTVGHKYWANTCPYCGAIQGDFYLYGEIESPFLGCDLIDESSFNYKMNMLRIAVHAKEIEML
ncbi:competence protein CoiA family protein [Thermoanaerobacter thermohydrosulfuricus]